MIEALAIQISELNKNDMTVLLEMIHNEITVIDTYGCLFELEQLIEALKESND